MLHHGDYWKSFKKLLKAIISSLLTYEVSGSHQFNEISGFNNMLELINNHHITTLHKRIWNNGSCSVIIPVVAVDSIRRSDRVIDTDVPDICSENFSFRHSKKWLFALPCCVRRMCHTKTGAKVGLALTLSVAHSHRRKRRLVSSQNKSVK
jgi:hypothetical protein